MPQPEMLALALRIQDEYGRLICSSGARCDRYTKSLRKRGYKAALGSAHNVGLALDLVPENGDIKAFQGFCISRLDEWDAWMEDPEATPKHAHLQKRPARSRVYKPWGKNGNKSADHHKP